jgi:hypothetical protein
MIFEIVPLLSRESLSLFLPNNECHHYFFRQAFELAWGNAYIFCRERPFTVYMDDISFEAPVEVGNLLYFNAQICFVHEHYIQVSLIVDTRAGLL